MHFGPQSGEKGLSGNSNDPQLHWSSANNGADLHKIFFDNNSYHRGYGDAYQKYGIDPKAGCIVVVRPDQCKSWQSFANDVHR